MRQILLDHAKSKGRQKRGKTCPRGCESCRRGSHRKFRGNLALDEAVCRLEQQEPDVGRVVRLRFFAGLSIDQIAALLQIAPRTVDRRWQFARAWLFREQMIRRPALRNLDMISLSKCEPL